MTKAYIGVGSNINHELNIEKALDLLKKSVEVVGISSFYKTEPLLNKNIDFFINGVWEINTNLEAKKLKFNVLKNIEKKLHRKKSNNKYFSRTIDLDLLLYGNTVINNKKIVIPDPDIYTRPFIYIPLYELNPELILPDTGKHIKDIISDLNKNKLILMQEFSEYLKNKIKH